MNNEKLIPAFEWKSVLQDLPEDQTYLLFCFGVNVVEGSYDKGLWLSIAYGEAQPDFWAYLPEPPHHKDRKSLYSASSIDALQAKVNALEMELGDLPQAQREMMLALGTANKERDTLQAKVKELEQTIKDQMICAEGQDNDWDNLNNENDTLQAKAMELSYGWEQERNGADTLAKTVVALRQQLEAVSKDAARYRWLMDHCGFGIRLSGVNELTVAFHTNMPDNIADMDSAIDAAMQKETP